jgi:general secretion pathway protein A
MMNKFFGFVKTPFGTELTSYLLHENMKKNKDLLSAVLYTNKMCLVTGKVGVGKTTLVKSFINDLDPMEFKVIKVAFSNPSDRELYKNICAAAGLRPSFYGDDIKLQMLSHFDELIMQGKQIIIVVDEIQTCTISLLQELRTFFDLKNQFSLIMVGLPGIHRTLSYTESLPLKQRISLFIEVKELSLAETAGYIDYHLKYAGINHPVFDEHCIPAIYQFSNGIPRAVDQLCFQSLLIAYQKKLSIINDEIVKEAINVLNYT